MKIEFQDKTVVVTGAAHGFGRAIALAFAERGAQCGLVTSSRTSWPRPGNFAQRSATVAQCVPWTLLTGRPCLISSSGSQHDRAGWT
jgi:NAD(P)-dependent dehydrogenase (short-subunit alcohol dehydrogenase family)